MGVHGLWRLIEPSGKPVPLETLENKVLAVDVSIWLHQAIKGFQDSKGAPIPNAHLLGIYHRVCKLLYFKIKPVFVFDGGVPVLKRQTIVRRNQQKSKTTSEADRIQKQLLNTLMKHTAISKVLSERITKASFAPDPKTKPDNLYALPPSELASTPSSDEESTATAPKTYDLHTIDMKSAHFKSLPVDVRHEILTELKETRKQNSWGRLHELPQQSDDFSSFQMERLLKRQAVQAALEEAAHEMGGACLSLAELESILQDQGVQTTADSIGKRIASDENTRYLFIKDVKDAMEKAKRKNLEERTGQDEGDQLQRAIELSLQGGKRQGKADLEEESELERAIALSLQETPSTSAGSKETFEFSYLDCLHDDDSDSGSGSEGESATTKKPLSSAQHYMMEYSGLTPSEISKIIEGNVNHKMKKTASSGTLQEENIVLEEPTGEPSRKNSEAVVLGANKEIQIDLTNEPKELDSLHDDDSDSGSESATTKKPNIIERNENHKMKKTASSGTLQEENIVLGEPTGEPSRKNSEAVVLSANKETQIDLTNNEPKELDSLHDDDSDSGSESATTKKPNIIERNENHKMKKTASSGTLQEKNIVLEEPTGEPSRKNSEAVLLGTNMDIQIDLANNDPDGDPKEAQTISDSDESSDSGDFQEVTECEDEKTTIEIVIDPNSGIEDDIFKDIFANEQQPNLDGEKIDNIVEQTLPKLAPEEKTKTEVAKPIENENVDVVVETPKVPEEKLSSEIVQSSKEPVMTIEELTDLRNSLQKDSTDLLIEKSTKERLASNITDQMYQEAQELLELFGVPYLIAPMEAEAQCAFLDAADLTDGTITDDSDVWLFGGRTVYKNFFNQSKYVMEFHSDSIRRHFKLSREQMILLALLVGSDYTTGVPGVGPVTAMEILAAFPPARPDAQLVSGLREFRAWFAGGLGRAALKSKLRNIAFADNFPSLQVVQAYLEPTVEDSREEFSWGKPDVAALTLFAREKFGWASRKTEEILGPVIKRLEENRSQKLIKEYFKTKFKVDSGGVTDKLSKRVKSAIDKFGKSREELVADDMEQLEKEKRKAIKRARRAPPEPKPTKVVDKDPAETTKPSTSNKRAKKLPVAPFPEPTSAADDLKEYETLATQLRTRRKKKNELIKLKQQEVPNKKTKLSTEIDEEMKLLAATTSRSVRREREIQEELKRKFELRAVPVVRQEEVIHQRLRNKSDLLKNKMRAIEVFRKSKKGPGYVQKRGRKRVQLKEDAGLSEDSD